VTKPLTFESAIQAEEVCVAVKLIVILNHDSSALAAHRLDLALCHELQSLMCQTMQLFDRLRVRA